MKRRGPQRWQPRGGAIVAPDPRAMLAIAAPPRARIGVAIALPLSFALHVAGVAYLSPRDPAPVVTTAPIEVALLREAAPGPIEAPPAPTPPRVVPPPPAPKPVAKQPVAKPTPPRVAAVAKPAPTAEAAPAAAVVDAAATTSAAGEAAPAAVSAAPPSSAGRGGGGDLLKSYVASVLRQIEAKKRYPSLAKSRGIEGTVVVTLWISPAGAIDRLEVGGEAPPLLVSSTRDAVQNASPFPPPPAGLPSIRVPIRYALR